MPDYPTTLHFEIGGFTETCHQIEFMDGKLQYRRAEGAYVWEPAISLEPDSAAWDRFWQGVESAGVWSWEKGYWNPDILDGTQWSLKLNHQGRSIKTDGSNAFPGSQQPDDPAKCEFGQFIEAVRKLTGRVEIECGPDYFASPTGNASRTRPLESVRQAFCNLNGPSLEAHSTV